MPRSLRRFLPAISTACLALAHARTAVAQERVSGSAATQDSLVKAILGELIAFNTAPSGRQMTRANTAMAAHLRSAGYAAADVQLAGPDSLHQNLVATLRGSDPAATPILLMAHIDVVEALRDDWSMDPYAMHEVEGYLYGRGSTDNKGGAAVIMANMIRWKRERFVPARDVIAIFTTDEETSQQDGIVWLLANVPRLAKAEYALNSDAGGFTEGVGGKPPRFYVQSSEKLYQTFTLEVTNRGGHSSLPRADNAIYSLARALSRVEGYRFPVMYNEVTRTAFAREAALSQGALAADLRALAAGATSGPAVTRAARDPSTNGNLRTTCVATMLSGGHAENALPQKAIATVNCRIFPGVSAQEVHARLQRVVADTSVHVVMGTSSVPSGASPLRADVLPVVEATAREVWPGAVAIPYMENGATDGLYLRNLKVPVYGVAGPLYLSSDDRAHGRDERVAVAHLNAAREYWYRVVKALAAGTTRM
jgi:acetylornithine deacetylase/succinyl-diaminopimelate desuccinylase-like protein